MFAAIVTWMAVASKWFRPGMGTVLDYTTADQDGHTAPAVSLSVWWQT